MPSKIDEILRLQSGAPIQLALEESEDSYAGGVRIVANTGKPWRLWGSRRAVVDLATLRYGQDEPLLYDHNTGEIIGISRKAEMTDEGLVQSGELFFDDNERAAEVRRNAAKGIKYQASIGFKTGTVEMVEGEGVECNGHAMQPGDMILRNCELLETSITLFGKDDQTSTEVLRLSLAKAANLDLSESEETMSDTRKDDVSRENAEQNHTTETPTPKPSPATFAELKAEFPDSPDFIVMALDTGYTLSQAQKAFIDRERAAIEVERKKIEEQKAQLSTQSKESLGADPVAVSVSDEEYVDSLPFDQKLSLGYQKEDLAAYAKFENRITYYGNASFDGDPR